MVGRRALRWWWMPLALPWVTTACVYDLNTFALSDRDPEACEPAATTDWVVLPNCQLATPLQVTVGTGDPQFRLFTPGEAPELHDGTPAQGPGVHHIFVGVRIANPDPAGGKFLLTFLADEPVPGAAAGVTRTSQLQLVVAQSLIKASDGALSRAGLRMFVGAPPLRITVRVKDQCGRSAEATHQVGP